MKHGRAGLRRCVAAACAAAAAPAFAHGAVPGIGAFYSGVLHPFISPAHLIALLALGLMVGQHAGREVQRTGAPLGVMGAVLAIALALHAWAGDPDTDRLLLGCAAVLGIAVAAARPWPAALGWLAAALVGAAVGVASGPSGVQGSTRVTMLLGTGVASFMLPAYVAVMLTLLRRPWQQIAVRVLGSWLAAAALLVLALGFATARRAAGAGCRQRCRPQCRLSMPHLASAVPGIA